jgi:hypothetical protein
MIHADKAVNGLAWLQVVDVMEQTVIYGPGHSQGDGP